MLRKALQKEIFVKKRILVIGTGGTIACKQSESGLIPVISAEELVTHVPDVTEYADVESIQVCNIDSTDIVPSDWVSFAESIERKYDDFDGFVICHGTDTLAYTAAALSYLIQDSVKPIVITGAQKPIDAEDTDARRNLRDSILYASSELASGVVIVFDGKVIAGTRAKKEKSKSYDAFTSINFPNLAIIRDGRVIQYITHSAFDAADSGRAIAAGNAAATHSASTFFNKVSDKVCTLKLTPGFDGSLLPILFDKYDCLIIESFGVGGIPSYLMQEFEKQMSLHNTLVIVATQVANEGSDMAIYQVGHDVKYDFDLLETYDMTLEAAFTKACWLLGQDGISKEEFKNKFYSPINYDITMF